ncbi:hypothetical protein PoB_000067800 [Plakobranchus ocellatus]|uniref:Uncharacterized protein n=1 Tax=Plakobranchus ocellatus TaxID=259542 RepID=A0AAV3XV62_9GAST|nr:hypothetical protein PoB_000067800 [Plakobranchus ocellatus]
MVQGRCVFKKCALYQGPLKEHSGTGHLCSFDIDELETGVEGVHSTFRAFPLVIVTWRFGTPVGLGVTEGTKVIEGRGTTSLTVLGVLRFLERLWALWNS